MAEEREQILRTLEQVVEPLCATLIGDSEVVLHDLAALPDSIVAIAGNLTGRDVGGRATDQFRELHASGSLATKTAYRSVLPDGRHIRSSTMLVADSTGEQIAALCINVDVSAWSELHAMAALVVGDASFGAAATATSATSAPLGEAEGLGEISDIDQLAALILTEVIEHAEAPVELMQKRHKVAVVAELKARGFFGLREAAERAAEALQVSRFSIYNYLRELEEEQETPSRGLIS